MADFDHAGRSRKTESISYHITEETETETDIWLCEDSKTPKDLSTAPGAMVANDWPRVHSKPNGAESICPHDQNGIPDIPKS